MKKFCLLDYTNTANLGDEIQSIAARRFLPQVDRYVDREALNDVRSEDGASYWMIMNGWFCHRAENWPPSPALRPLPVSLHISPAPGVAGGVGLVPAEILLSQSLKNYLRGFGPVGARDKATLKRLQDAGVASYFSGCLTLTLPRPGVAKDPGLIVANEVPSEVLNTLQHRTRKRIVTTTHWNEHTTDRDERFGLAESLLATYASASCVITTRLHCALPCTAMGTPVLLLDTAQDQHRFDGLHDFVRHCTVRDYLSGTVDFDLDTPSPNPDTHLPFARALQERVQAFIAAPAEPAMPYPLTAEELQAGLRLINQRTTQVLFGERGRRVALEKRLAELAKAPS